jgi:chromosome partitioning protein
LTAHLAYYALDVGLKVLLVDMDKQGSLSLSFSGGGGKPGLLASQLFDAESASAKPESITPTLSIIRADNGLLAIDKAENEVIRRPGDALRKFARHFDLCLIDTPPLLGIRSMAALTASHYVVTPVSIGLYELAGVADLMQTIQVVRTQGFNPGLKHVGIQLMKTNSRSKEAAQALDDLREMYGKAILPDVLPERAAVMQAVAQLKPVWTATRGESHKKAADEWRAACKTIIGRITK